MTGGVLFHVQHLLGIGHLQRSLRIAEGLAARGISVTLAHGGPPVPALAAARGVTVATLPAICARDATFALVDLDGNPVSDALRAARRDRLLAIFAETRPDVVAIEGFPFARRAFRFELDPLIAAARTTGARVVCSVRDIPTVRDDPQRHRWIVERVRGDFDLVLVHGDQSFIPFDVPFSPAPQIADKLVYTGYVDGPRPSRPHSGGTPAVQAEVVVSVGGGAAGRLLLDAALAARRGGCLADRPWRILAGTALGDEAFAALQRDAPGGTTIERFRADFPALLRECHVSVSQAGYNTVLDILAARARAVLVPFSAERETEQTIRAEHLARLGAAELVRETELSGASLAAAIERAAVREPARLALDTGGAARSAAEIVHLLAK